MTNEELEYDDAELCLSCNGMGGYDATDDCEAYDDWHTCPECEGTGLAIPGDSFIPERDAWTPCD